jgi:hypothetical protein
MIPHIDLDKSLETYDEWVEEQVAKETEETAAEVAEYELKLAKAAVSHLQDRQSSQGLLTMLTGGCKG